MKRMKKWISLILALSFVMAISPLANAALPPEEEENEPLLSWTFTTDPPPSYIQFKTTNTLLRRNTLISNIAEATGSELAEAAVEAVAQALDLTPDLPIVMTIAEAVVSGIIAGSMEPVLYYEMYVYEAESPHTGFYQKRVTYFYSDADYTNFLYNATPIITYGHKG